MPQRPPATELSDTWRSRPSRATCIAVAFVVALTLALALVKPPARAVSPTSGRDLGGYDSTIASPRPTHQQRGTLQPNLVGGTDTRDAPPASAAAAAPAPIDDVVFAPLPAPDVIPQMLPPPPPEAPPLPPNGAGTPPQPAPTVQRADLQTEPATAATASCWAEGLRGGGVFGGIGDSLARDTVWRLRAVSANAKLRVVFKNERKVHLQAMAADVSDFVERELKAGASHNATLLASRGLWEALNLANPPSTTFAAVGAMVRQWQAMAGGPAGTVRRLVLNIPHCAHALTAAHRLRCGGAGNLGLYQRAVACAAVQELRSRTASMGAPQKGDPRRGGGGGASVAGGDVRLAVYDSCSVVRRDDPRGMADSWHMSPRMLNRTVSYMLARFVCPGHAAAAGIDATPSDETGWFVDAGLGASAEDVEARRAAAAAIEARWDCAAFAVGASAVSRPDAAVAPSSSSTVPDTFAELSTPPAGDAEARAPTRPAPSPLAPSSRAWWPTCNSTGGAGTSVDRALDYKFMPECACSLPDRMYSSDACWSSITVVKRSNARQPFRAFALTQVCNLKTTTRLSKVCAADTVSTLPESIATDAAALHEMGVVGCVAPDAQHLCLHNLGATILPSVEDRDAAHAMLVNVSGLTDADDVAAVCRCHLAATMANATEGRRVAGSRWCRSYATVEQRVRGVYSSAGKRALARVLSSKPRGLDKAGATAGGGAHPLLARWLRALVRAPSTFDCGAPSLVYLQMCGWLSPLHDVREAPMTDAAAAERAVRVAYRQAHPRAAKKGGVSIPSFSEW